MKTRWILLISLFSLALGSCGASQTMVQDSPTPAPADTNMVSPITPDAASTTVSGVTTTVATPAIIETGVWKNYHNTQTEYNASYPADWTVNESAGINDELITTFMAPNDAGQGIVVSVLNGEVAVEEIPDMPNTRCELVTISGLSGRRCFDTLALSISTTLSGFSKQYTITSFGKHLDQNIYQRFLESFTVTP